MARAGLKPDTVITINIKGKMTNEEKIQEIDRQIKRVISHEEGRIADYNRQIAENYCNFFHWHAGDMYEAQTIREYFVNIVELPELGDAERVAKYLDRMIRTIESELINRSSFGSCTDEIVNLEHRLKLEAQRAIREKLLSLHTIATYNEK